MNLAVTKVKTVRFKSRVAVQTGETVICEVNMKLLAITVAALITLFVAVRAYAAPLRLEWDAVTQNTDGSPVNIATLKYKMYRKNVNYGDFMLLTTTRNTYYTQQVVSWGHFIYRVTAINEHGESTPSNELKVFIDLVGKEEQ